MRKQFSGKSWILVLAGLAVLAKLYCASVTFGTDDVVLYFAWGKIVATEGLNGALAMPQFNHTPLVAWYSAFLFKILPGNDDLFPLLIKLPGILSSFGSVLAVCWLRRRYTDIPLWGIALFALSPVAFMVDGFHGNLDSVLVFLLLLAACACAMERPNWWLCGLCLAMATQIKVVALLLSPIFFFFWWHRERGGRFLALVSAAVLLGWLPGLLVTPFGFLRNVLGYGSVWGVWGITYLLHETGRPEFGPVHWVGLTPAQILVSHFLKLFIVGAIVVAGWRRRREEGIVLIQTIAFAWVLFFTLAPGLGMQYLVWFAPFVLVWNARWFVALLGICSAAMFFFYNVACGGMPWVQTSGDFSPYMWSLMFPWLAFLACSISFLRQHRAGTRGNGASQEALPPDRSLAGVGELVSN